MKKECPISGLDDRALENNDRDALCSYFNCDTCVAEPEDFGWYPGIRKDMERELENSASNADAYVIPF